MSTLKPLGVGILGAGPVTQAIHLPTLGGMADEFRVVHISDVSVETARTVAAPLGARWSASIGELLTDDDVDVVAVCSPHRFHAEHTAAAMRAGRAVLCEKPLALELAEVDELTVAARTARVPFLVGWMHAYDPVAVTAIADWLSTGQIARAIRVSTLLPPNGGFERAATELVESALAGGATSGAPLREALLTLAVHDVPLLRRLLPGPVRAVEIMHASWRPPWGYLVLGTVNDVRLELFASFGRASRPTWTLEAVSETAVLSLEFPPSYVHTGSATAQLRTAERPGVLQESVTEDGYDGEWRRLARAVRAGEVGALDDSLIDAGFAIDLADAADRRAQRGGR